MVIDDLDVFRPGIRPGETDAILIVDSNTMLASALPGQLLQPVFGRCSQVPEPLSLVELVELPSSDFPQALGAGSPRRLGIGAIEDVPGTTGGERLDHAGL